METTVERAAEIGAVLLGWPAVMGSVIVFGFALARRSRRLAALGWALASPMLAYLALSARFRYTAPIAWLALGVAVWAIRRHPRVALALLAPAVAHVLSLAWMVTAPGAGGAP